MRTFLHLGYPKCFSTTLQRQFYSVHPQIHFGGIGTETNIDFANRSLNLLFESGIIYFRNRRFQSELENFQSTLADFAGTASPGKQVCGFSSEHLLFNFTPQTVDIEEKIKRIQLLFGDQVQLVLVFREQLSLLVSLYKEYVNMGYRHGLDHFLQWVYQFQDRNFYGELLYADVLDQMFQVFDRQQVKVLFFETYKNQSSAALDPVLFDDIAEFLSIDKPALKGIENSNPSLAADEIDARLKANQSFSYDFGDEILGGLENHRRRVFFNDYLELGLAEEQLFANVLEKRKSRELAKQLAKQLAPSSNLQWNRVAANSLQRILTDFDHDHHRLADQFGINVQPAFSAARELATQQLAIVN